MHRFLLSVSTLLFATIFVSSCSGKTKHDLQISPTVTIVRDNQHTQVPGTTVFFNVPKSYELVPQIVRYQKNNTAFIQVFENLAKPFELSEAKKAISEKLYGVNSSELYYQKQFKLESDDALILYGADTKPGFDQIVLLFGNSNYTVMAVGEVLSTDILELRGGLIFE